MTGSAARTQFPTQEADPVVVTEAMCLVLVEADEAVVLVIPVNHVSCLVGRCAIMSLSLDKEGNNSKIP